MTAIRGTRNALPWLLAGLLALPALGAIPRQADAGDGRRVIIRTGGFRAGKVVVKRGGANRFGRRVIIRTGGFRSGNVVVVKNRFGRRGFVGNRSGRVVAISTRRGPGVFMKDRLGGRVFVRDDFDGVFAKNGFGSNVVIVKDRRGRHFFADKDNVSSFGRKGIVVVRGFDRFAVRSFGGGRRSGSTVSTFNGATGVSGIRRSGNAVSTFNGATGVSGIGR